MGRYNRHLMVKTIKAMQVVDKIRTVRKERFHKQRLATQLKKRMTSAQKEAAKGANLLEGPNKLKALSYQKELDAATKVKIKKKVKVTQRAAGGSMDIED